MRRAFCLSNFARARPLRDDHEPRGPQFDGFLGIKRQREASEVPLGVRALAR